MESRNDVQGGNSQPHYDLRDAFARVGRSIRRIQAALDRCPSNQVVMLNPGTFIVNNYVLIHRGITLRGSGAGVTILNKANGATCETVYDCSRDKWYSNAAKKSKLVYV